MAVPVFDGLNDKVIKIVKNTDRGKSVFNIVYIGFYKKTINQRLGFLKKECQIFALRSASSYPRPIRAAKIMGQAGASDGGSSP